MTTIANPGQLLASAQLPLDAALPANSRTALPTNQPFLQSSRKTGEAKRA